jgi:hypothetical protein
MDTNRIPKQALQYRPIRLKNIGRPRKRWKDQLHLEDQGTGTSRLTLHERDDGDDDDEITHTQIGHKLYIPISFSFHNYQKVLE